MIFSCGKSALIPESVQDVFRLPVAYQFTTMDDNPFFLPISLQDFSRFVLEFQDLRCREEDFESESVKMFVRLEHLEPAFYALIQSGATGLPGLFDFLEHDKLSSEEKKEFCSKLESFWEKVKFLYPACFYTAHIAKPRLNRTGHAECIIETRENVDWRHEGVELPQTVVIKQSPDCGIEAEGLFVTFKMNELYFPLFVSEQEHPNIHSQLGMVFKPPKNDCYEWMGYVSEYASHDSLRVFFENYWIDSGVDALLTQLIGVAEAINSMHQKGWVHRDIKMENIFVNVEPGHFQLKLADFGLCSPYSKCQPSKRRSDWFSNRERLSKIYPDEMYRPTNNPNHYKQYDWKMFSYVVRDTMDNVSDGWPALYPSVWKLIKTFDELDYLEMKNTVEVVKQLLELEIATCRKKYGAQELKFSK